MQLPRPNPGYQTVNPASRPVVKGWRRRRPGRRPDLARRLDAGPELAGGPAVQVGAAGGGVPLPAAASRVARFASGDGDGPASRWPAVRWNRFEAHAAGPSEPTMTRRSTSTPQPPAPGGPLLLNVQQLAATWPSPRSPPIHVGHQDLRPSSTMTRSSGAAEAAASGWSAGPVEPDCHSDNPTSRPTPRRVIAGGPGRQVAAALTLARSAEGGAGRSMVQRCKGAASDEGGPVHPPNVEHLAVASSRVARSLGTGGLPARSPPQLPAPGGPPPAECSAAGPRRRRRRRSASCCSFRRGWPPASRVISAGDLAGGPGRLGAGPLRCRSRSAPPRVQLQVPQLRYCEATRTNLPSIDAQVPASSPLPAHGRPRDLPGTYQAGDACGSVSHKGFGVNTLDWYSHGRGSWGRYSLVAGVSGDRRPLPPLYRHKKGLLLPPRRDRRGRWTWTARTPPKLDPPELEEPSGLSV